MSEPSTSLPECCDEVPGDEPKMLSLALSDSDPDPDESILLTQNVELNFKFFIFWMTDLENELAGIFEAQI